MNRKDGGKGGRTREGALSWSPGENFRERGQGARRNGGREEAGNAGGKEERGKEEAIFGVFFGKKRKKEG